MSNPVTQEELKQKLGHGIAHGTYMDEEAREAYFNELVEAIEAYKDNACRELLDELYKIEACGWYDMDFDLVDSFDDAFEQGSDRTKAKFEKVIQAKRNTLNQSKEDV